MTFQQFGQHLDGLRRAIAPGSTPDPDGVLWNTDDSARYVAEILDAVALLDTIAESRVLDLDAPDFVDNPGPQGGALATAIVPLSDVPTPALVTGVSVSISTSQVTTERVRVGAFRAGQGTRGAYLQLFDNIANTLPPPAAPLADILWLRALVEPFNPTFIYPLQPDAVPVIEVAAQADDFPPPPDLTVRVVIDLARVRSLPLAPPFPR